jgi:predicted TIM-barrel fold metal-dependent hydrolase
LAQLYDFCGHEDVPILAHCSLSQDPSDAAGRRGSPKAWGAALAPDRWPTLRLNLGHFGGVWSLPRPHPDGWTQEAVDLMVIRPNVYADISDLSTAVGADDAEITDQRVIVRELNRIFTAADPQRVARGKLMYGTDWVMLARDPGIEAYYPKMKTQFTADLQLTEAEKRGFLGLNAARFLGLIPPLGQIGMPKTRQRLEAFYKAHGLNNAVLAKWDGAAAV